MYRIKIKDVTVSECEANNTNTHLPRYIITEIIDAITNMPVDHFGLGYLPGYALYDRSDLVNYRGQLVDANNEHFSFVKSVLRRLVSTIDISELTVYASRNDVAIIKIGSYLVTPISYSGIRVLNDEEEIETLKILLSCAYGCRVLTENSRFTITMRLNDKEGKISVGTALQPESSGKFIKLKIYNGLEFMKLVCDEKEFESIEQANKVIGISPTDICIKTFERVEGAVREIDKIIESIEDLKRRLTAYGNINHLDIVNIVYGMKFHDCLNSVIVDKTLPRDIDDFYYEIYKLLFKDFTADKVGFLYNKLIAELEENINSSKVRHILSRLNFYKKVCLQHIMYM